MFYFQSLKRASQGDLGSSLTLHQPVSKLLRERAPLTLRLIGVALLVSWGRRWRWRSVLPVCA